MNGLTLSQWTEEFKARFTERDLCYMRVERAEIFIQLADSETGEIHLHKLEYQSKTAQRTLTTSLNQR